MNIARMAEVTTESGQRGIRRRQQGGSRRIQMPDGQPCSIFICIPAIVTQLTMNGEKCF